MERKLIYEGKAKRIFEIPGDKSSYVQEFKDDATAFNGLKKDKIKGKGSINNIVSAALFEYLEKSGIPTHYLKTLTENEMLVKRVSILKLEVVCRNIAAGSLVKRYGLKEGETLKFPVIEFYLKSDELGDPLLTESHIYAFNIARPQEIDILKNITVKINDLLKSYFLDRNILLVDFKLEFGKDSEGNIILADEISPDTCRLWDSVTQKKLDKDRFRFDLGDVEDAYEEIKKRITNK